MAMSGLGWGKPLVGGKELINYLLKLTEIPLSQPLISVYIHAGTNALPGGSEADWRVTEPGGEGGVWEGDQGD